MREIQLKSICWSMETVARWRIIVICIWLMDGFSMNRQWWRPLETGGDSSCEALKMKNEEETG